MTLGMIHGMTHTGADRHHTIHTIRTIPTDRHPDQDHTQAHILVLVTQADTHAAHRADIQVQPVAGVYHRAITQATARAKAEATLAAETTYVATQVAAPAAAAHQQDH